MSPAIGSLFTGAGALCELAVAPLLGGRVVWHCEYEPPTAKIPKPSQAAARVLAHRFPGTPNLGDITAVDWSSVEPVEVATGGFPCTDVSTAGQRAGLRPDTRSGLWSHMAFAISVLRPRLVVIENVRDLASATAHSDVEPCSWCLGDDPDEPALRALGAVLGDLADLGFDAEWCGLRASDVGACHARFRFVVVAAPADTASAGWPGSGLPGVGVGRSAGPAAGRDDPEPLHLIPTPTAADAERSSATYGRGNPTLLGALLRTPTASRGGYNQSPSPGAAVRPTLDSIATLLPTPRATDGTKGGPNQRGSSGDLMLPSVATLVDGDTVDWGIYEPAIRRHERWLGRSAPHPTVLGARGGKTLNPQLSEWMMGWPAGWVTDVPGITPNEAKQVCGNGVVPQQMAAAIRYLLPLLAEGRWAA